jgi:phosphoribosylglycinamide formyltransferase 1
MALRLAVLISAGGSTLQNLIDHIRAGKLDAQIVSVVSSRPDVYGLERARQAGLTGHVVSRKAAGSRDEFGRKMFDVIRHSGAELVCLAGFLELLPIPDDFENRVMNIHPSLIPAFCGKGFYGHHVHQSAIEAGVKISGCTVHFADNVFDHGPIILQRTVQVLDEDTPETLAARVQAEEAIAYPEAIRLFGAQRISVVGRRTVIRPAREAP